MQKTSLVVGATLALALGAVIHAQRGGITPEMIATALPLEGAPLAVPGPYKVDSGPAFGSPGHVVYRPADLAPFPGKDTLPVMVWGNGGCAINSTRYAGFLTTIASHGFVVLATAAEPGAERRRSTADDLRAAIDWAEADFQYLLGATRLTKGNLSSHLGKLEAAGLVQVTKGFKGKKPWTRIMLTREGRTRIQDHWEELERIRRETAELA